MDENNVVPFKPIKAKRGNNVEPPVEEGPAQAECIKEFVDFATASNFRLVCVAFDAENEFLYTVANEGDLTSTIGLLEYAKHAFIQNGSQFTNNEFTISGDNEE